VELSGSSYVSIYVFAHQVASLKAENKPEDEQCTDVPRKYKVVGASRIVIVPIFALPTLNSGFGRTT